VSPRRTAPAGEEPDHGEGHRIGGDIDQVDGAEPDPGDEHAARAGPTTIDRAMVVVCRVTAAVTSSVDTSMGRAARRAGQSMPWNPALAAAHTNSTHTSGGPARR